jgi:dipeptidyl aminopeptidase/acylaminoacyl peptidase
MEQHTFVAEGADFDVDVSPDGEWIVFSSTRHTMRPNLYLKTIHGRAVTQLTSDPAADVQPAFRPDGKGVTFASDRSGNWDLWMIGVDGGQPTQVTGRRCTKFIRRFRRMARAGVLRVQLEGGPMELWTVDWPGAKIGR